MDAQIFLRDDYLRTAFDMFDKDGSGKIDKEEIRSLLCGEDLSQIVSKDELEKYLAEVDENGDGEIDFTEFQLMMEKCKNL